MNVRLEIYGRCASYYIVKGNDTCLLESMIETEQAKFRAERLAKFLDVPLVVID